MKNTQSFGYNNVQASVMYEVPIGLESNEFDNIIKQILLLAKEKGLTVKDAQYIFKCCGELALYSKME